MSNRQSHDRCMNCRILGRRIGNLIYKHSSHMRDTGTTRESGLYWFSTRELVAEEGTNLCTRNEGLINKTRVTDFSAMISGLVESKLTAKTTSKLKFFDVMRRT